MNKTVKVILWIVGIAVLVYLAVVALGLFVVKSETQTSESETTVPQ